MITRYARGCFISFTAFVVGTVLFSVAINTRLIRTGDYLQTQRFNRDAQIALVFLSGVLFEATTGLFRIDILDNLNKLTIRRHRSD